MGGRGGSSGFIGGNNAIRKIEKSISEERTEIAYIFDDDGTIIFSKSDGKKDYVEFTPSQVEKLKGKILSHNHPSGSTFSVEDINMFEKMSIKEIRATTKSGTFSLSQNDTREEDTESKKEMAMIYSEAVRIYKKPLDKKYKEELNLYRESKISAEEFQNQCNILNSSVTNFQHEWLSEKASSYGYNYKFERWR